VIDAFGLLSTILKKEYPFNSKIKALDHFIANIQSIFSSGMGRRVINELVLEILLND